jgi:hypothetical protein
VAQRVAQPIPVTASALTTVRSVVEVFFEDSLAGVTVVDDPHGWSAEEGLEQHALQIAVDFLINRCLHNQSTNGAHK